MLNGTNLTILHTNSLNVLFGLTGMLLIPVFMSLFHQDRRDLAFAVLVLSAVSDMLDGVIARKFNMGTELGAAIDPLADKLNQGAILYCLGEERPIIFALFLIHVLKEIYSGVWSLVLMKKTGHVYGSKWYGKALTWIIYLSCAVLMLIRDIPSSVAAALAYLCMFGCFFCLVAYTLRGVQVLKNKEHNTES